MNILIAEDDFVCRTLLQEILGVYGTVDVATNGREAIDSFTQSTETGEPYQLICLDIMMPEVDGQQALKEIRRIEQEKGVSGANAVKIIMTTALGDPKNIMEALLKGHCDAYINKPVSAEEIEKIMSDFGFDKVGEDP